MHIRSRRLLRAGAVAGLVATALPLSHASWSPVQHAHAARMEVRGFSPSLLSQAATTPMHMIFLLRPGAGSGASALMRTLQQTGASDITPLGLIGGVAAQVSSGTLSALRYDPNLLAMTVDRVHTPLPIPDADAIAAQVARAELRVAGGAPPAADVIRQPDTLSIIHADAAQKQYNGRGVRIAIVDSGIDYMHPDLRGIMLRGPNGKPLYKDFTGTDLTDTVGHGTAVAGVIAAQARTVYSVTNTYRTSVYPLANPRQRFENRTYFTVGGVAPGARIMAAKIFDSRLPGDGGYDSTIVRAIQWAIANHADVISESFGQTAVVQTNTSTDVVALADEEAVRHGITVVAADGNTGPGTSSVSSPAQAPDVIAAGASTDYQAFGQSGFLADYNATISDNLASFTSRGPTYDGRIRPDIYAPGSFGWSTVPRNPSEETDPTAPHLLELFGGTSMATPVIAASAALVINAYMETHHGRRPAPAYVKQVLTSSADNLGYPAGDQAAGRVDAERAIDMVLHHGPSVLLSGSLALQGRTGDRPSHAITVTNSGSTPERVTFDPQVTHTSKTLSFGGTVIADNLVTYKFAVPAGTTKVTAAAYWANTRTIPLPGQQAVPVAMVVRLYDPHGNFVNYTYSGSAGAANVKTTAGHPEPGIWTAVVSERTRHDTNQQAAHYVNVPFTGVITLDTFQNGGGTVSPRQIVLKPGQRATVTYRADRLTAAGTRIISLHVREQSLAPSTPGQPRDETTATIPVVVTTGITMGRGQGFFSGTFTGADDAGFDEVNYFNFDVPNGARNIAVAMAWPNSGYWFAMALLDPEGRAFNLLDNALITGGGNGSIDLTSAASPTSQIDLSQRAIDAFVNHPQPGHWRIEIVNLQFAGTQAREPYIGVVRLNVSPARLDRTTVTAQAGGAAVPFGIQATNLGAGLQAYFTYATTDQYTYLPLGGTGGALQDGPLGIGSTQILTYTTRFVPPGTREIISEAKALNSALPVAVQISDPVLLTYSRYGQPAPQTLGGTLGKGVAAVVRAPALPIGQWQATLTLPASAHTGEVYVAASTEGYSLQPNPWIKMDAQLQQSGRISATGFPVAQPGQTIFLHGSVRVPDGVAPGTYHAHIFVYSFREDQLADLPLTIKVGSVAPVAIPTADPYLAANVSSQYFPEGETGTGVTTQMDLVNPGDADAHAQIKLLTLQGWTTIKRYNLQPHSRMSINLQPLVGNDQSIATVLQGDEPIVGGRLIARPGAGGSYSVGTAAPSTHWYFADGYTVSPLQEYLNIVNPSTRTAHVHVHVVSDQGDVRDVTVPLPATSHGALRVSDLLNGKAVSASVSSDVPVVAERTEFFGTQGQGVTTTVGASEGATSAYLDPGHVPADAQGHIALYNPHSRAAHVTLTLIDRFGAPAHKLALTLKAGRRATVDLKARYGTISLGALVKSDVPIVAEKVAYFGIFKQSHIAGSDLLGVTAPAAHLVFPGGSTSAGEADTLALYNPGTAPAQADVIVIYHGNKMAHHLVRIPAGRRAIVKINDLGLPVGPNSLIVDALGGAQLYGTQTLMSKNGTDGTEINGVPFAG